MLKMILVAGALVAGTGVATAGTVRRWRRPA